MNNQKSRDNPNVPAQYQYGYSCPQIILPSRYDHVYCCEPDAICNVPTADGEFRTNYVPDVGSDGNMEPYGGSLAPGESVQLVIKCDEGGQAHGIKLEKNSHIKCFQN